MADEKTKVVTDTAGPDAGQTPTQPEASGGAPAPKQEQPAPEAVSPDKAPAPEQTAPVQAEKGADAPKEQKAASVSVFNFSEIMAEKKATKRAAAQQEAKAPDKAAPASQSKETGQKQEKPKEQEQPPKRRGRPPKEDKARSAAPAQKESPAKKDKAAQKAAPAKKAEKTPKAPKPAKGTPEVKAPAQPETPPAPAEAPRPAKDEQIVYLKLSDLHAFKNHPFQVRNDEEMKSCSVFGDKRICIIFINCFRILIITAIIGIHLLCSDVDCEFDYCISSTNVNTIGLRSLTAFRSHYAFPPSLSGKYFL